MPQGMTKREFLQSVRGHCWGGRRVSEYDGAWHDGTEYGPCEHTRFASWIGTWEAGGHPGRGDRRPGGGL